MKGAAGDERWDDRDRRALAAVAAQFWVNGMVYAAVVPRLPDIRDRLAIDVGVLGLALTIAALGGLIGSAFSGSAIGRFGTKRCILGATAITLAVLPAIGLTGSVIGLTVCLALLSMFDVVIDISMNIQGSRLSAKRAVPVMNRLHGLWSLGTVVGGFVAVRASGMGVPLWLHMSAVALVLALTVAVSSRFLLSTDEIPTDGAPVVAVQTAGAPVASSGPAATDGSPPLSATRSVASGARSGRTLRYGLLLGLLGGAAVAMEMTTSDWAAFRLADDLGAGPGQVGLGFVAFTAGMVTGRFAGDAVQGWLGSNALVRYAAALAAIGLLLATVVPADRLTELGLPAISPTAVAIVGFYVAALGVSVLFPQLYDRAAKAPGPPGRGLAALTAGTRVSGLIAPAVVGLVADTELSVGTAVALVTLPACGVTLIGSSLLSRPGDRRDLAAAATR